jgi:hypothetical protein
VAAQIIQARLEQYPFWRRRSVAHRRIASLATMAAMGEALSDLVTSGRIGEWETLVGPLSEFIGRALIDPDE